MPLKTQRDDQISINMTPMIDIVFLLIIFFMVGTRFSEIEQQERDIALKVPEVERVSALAQAPRKKIINVFGDGRITLDSVEVDLQTLESSLVQARAEYPATGVIVRGDAQSLYQHVAEVIATCRVANINDLNIAVKQTESR
jgi:biopolymer transport protein ExbD